jgi:hypothetical protein
MVLGPNVNFNGGGTNRPYRAQNGYTYFVYIDASSDVTFAKTNDQGITWTVSGTPVFAGTATQLSTWYDRDSGISAGLIHCAYVESGGDDVLYRTINTESNDDLSTEKTIHALTSTGTAGDGCLSICRTRGGNVVCAYNIDGAGAEQGFKKLLNANVPNGEWEAALASPMEGEAQDRIILMPGWAADNQDVMAFFWDVSATEISRKLYDDDVDSWAETSISATMTMGAATGAFPHFAAVPDTTNSQNILVAWSNVDTLNADLLGWKVTEGAVTALADIITNSTDDQGHCSVGIDTDTQDWHVFYGGLTGGADTYLTALNLCSKKSTDDGASWGPEERMSVGGGAITSLMCVPRFATTREVVIHNSVGQMFEYFTDYTAPSGGGGQRVFGG